MFGFIKSVNKILIINMKNLILLFITTICINAHSQIKVSETEKFDPVGEYKLLGTSYAKIERKNDYLFFTYKDEKFTTIDSYKSFYFKETDLESMFDLFYNMENKQVGDEKTVELENGDKLFFTYKKTFGKMHASVIHVDKAGVGGAIRYLTDKQLKKLFGKS